MSQRLDGQIAALKGEIRMAAKFAPLEEVRTLQDELTKLEEQKAAEEAPTTEA